MTDWTNKLGNVSGVATRVCYPESTSEVATIVADALAAGERVRVCGQAYSSSWVLQPDGAVVLDLSALRFFDHQRISFDRASGVPKTQGLPNPTARKTAAVGYAWVAASARVQDVLNFLRNDGLTLATTGAYSGQTFVGAVSTGTHGSGFMYGALADLVAAIEILVVVAGQLKWMHVQPAGGPLPTGGSVIENTDLFDALLVSLGAAGVITAMLVETVPLKGILKVNESRRIAWDRLRSHWLSPTDAQGRPLAFVEENGVPWETGGILIHPYTVRNDGMFETCLVSRGREEPAPPGDAVSPGRLPPDCLVHVANWYNNNAYEWDQRVLEVGNQLIRQYKHRHEWAELPDILTSDAGFGEIKGVGLEHVFALDGSGRCWDAIHAAMKHINDAAWTRSLALPGFLSVRFQGASRAWLALRPTPSVSVEVLTLLNDQDHGHQVLAEVEAVLASYGGRPHWGQIFGAGSTIYTYDASRVRAIAAACAGEIAAWVSALRTYGIETRPFECAATVDLGLVT